jgi:hypothetical protein
MIIRIGIPETTGLLVKTAVENGYHALVSAGSLWDNHKKRFRPAGVGLWDLPSVAMDSAGFVATKMHGGYRWTVAEYVAMVAEPRPGKRYPWAWWSQMDLCCEPEIAGDSAVVESRVRGTARLLGECRTEARRVGIPDPMPILQGWKPADYLRCADLIEQELGGQWPDLVGVGSVCRRQIEGPDGLLAVVKALDARLPSHVRLHLFGVKGTILAEFANNPRVGSVDSCAYDYASRKDVGNERRELQKRTGVSIQEATAAIPHRKARRAESMATWMGQAEAQQGEAPPVRQMGLFW